MLVSINTYLPSDEALMIGLEGIDAVLYFQARVAVMKRSDQLLAACLIEECSSNAAALGVSIVPTQADNQPGRGWRRLWIDS
jgi:hypothetical protein